MPLTFQDGKVVHTKAVESHTTVRPTKILALAALAKIELSIYNEKETAYALTVLKNFIKMST